MHKTIDYLYQLQAQDSLDIEDIGNTCIHILNDAGYEWYLIIETELGETRLKNFGPFCIDKPDWFIRGFNYNYFVIDYKEQRIISIIDNFINDNKKLITQAFTCEYEEAYEKLSKINFKEMR